jgi:hypothetical protein
MEVVSVFLSTTEDAAISKYHPIFREVAEQVCRLSDVHLNLLYWRDLAGGLGKTAQDVIDQRVVGKYQIYFGLMGLHFGIGTEREYRTAVDDHLKGGLPVYACFGFCDEKVNPSSIDAGSFSKLSQFRKDVGDGGSYGIANLYFTFDGEPSFRKRVETHLHHAIKLIKGRVAGGLSFGGT